MTWLSGILLLLLVQLAQNVSTDSTSASATSKQPTSEVPKPMSWLQFERLDSGHTHSRKLNLRVLKTAKSRKPTMIDIALQIAAKEGIDAMKDLYQNIEPEIVKNGQILENNHPAALLSKFSAPTEVSEKSAMAAFATIAATKAFRRNYKESTVLGRQAQSQKVSFRRTPLEGLCPPREAPTCMPASQRYRTHDGTCNNRRRPRWGSAQMPFNRFLPPEYGDGVDSIRGSVEGGPLSSARFVSLLVHGAREGDAPLTLMIAQWGQLLDHDMTSTAQPRSINGSVPSCCGSKDFHPSCFPIKVPLDDPWLAPLKVRCLEFLRSAPAQRRDCVLSWREQTNQVTSFIDASPIYSSNAKTSDNARIFRNGLLIYGRGNPSEDVCMRGALAHQCIRSGDGRSGEQPGLLALHHVWVGEHNRIAMELSNLNPHWSDEKVYQETRRIVGALFQHITYREFLPIVLGREVCKLFDIELLNSGFFTGYDPNTNPSVANSFAAAAFRFGHSLVQNSYMRCDRHHNFINNNVSLHEEFQHGDIGTAGSLHRLIRGLVAQRALKRDEFITPELTNHLFQTPGFPFGLDLAAINIQRGRDHGIAPYTAWRQPCGLSAIRSWDDLANVVGPESAKRISHAYRNVHDIDLFVGGIAERPVVGGLVGPTFACIIAQQFSNSRKGDRFWYENPGFESSFTPAQLHSLRHVSLASVLCRAVGGGTFQPHAFIPSDIAGNERVECGKDPLAPIDLKPWLEQDPFLAAGEKAQNPISQDAPLSPPMPVQVIKEEKGISNRVHNITMVGHVDFTPNGSTGFHRVPNVTKIHDKLDLAQKVIVRPSQKPFEGISNKLDKGRPPTKKLPKPVASMLSKRPGTTTRRTVVIHNVEIELRSSPKEQKTKKKKINRNNQQSLLDSAAQNTILKVAGVVRSQLNAAIDAVEPRTMEVDDDLTETVTDFTTSQPFDDNTDTEDDTETVTPKPHPTQQTITDNATMVTTFTDNSTQLNSTFEDFQSIIDSALQQPTDEHVRVHRSPSVELSTYMSFHDKLRTLTIPKANAFTSRQLTDEPFFELIPQLKLNPIDTQNATNLTTNSTKTDHFTTELPPTQRNVEVRQYHDRPIYHRPQKLILDGPNSDQYEIEINIRQTNLKPTPLPANYAEYSPNKRYDGDRYENEPQVQQNLPYAQSTKPQYVMRTRPPTIIYLNEHEDLKSTTTRTPGFFQNILSFASNGFNGNRHQAQTEPTSSPFHHIPNRIQNSATGYDGSSSSSSNKYSNTPTSQTYSQSKPVSGNYVNAPQTQQVQPFPPPQGYPQPQGFPPQAPPNYGPLTPLSGVPSGLPPPQGFPRPLPPGANSFSSVSNAGGVSHASSSAVSTGHFGAIVGSASTSGSDSTFSFNIRPSSRPQLNLVSPTSLRPNYESLPQRRPQYPSTPSYAVPPKPISSVETFHYPPNRQDPFSSHKRRPLPPYFDERPTNVFDPAYDELGRSELKLDDNGDTDLKTNRTDVDSAEYDYMDDDDVANDDSDSARNDVDLEEEPAKKFDEDGYLRPEHMAANLYEQAATNKTTLNATELDDNFVLPVLKQSDEFVESPTVTEHTLPNITDATPYPDTQQKGLSNDILADDYDDLLTARASFLAARAAVRAEKRRRPAINLQVAFAPINILTKPERPDNWVMFDTPEEKPLLPVLPEYNTETLVAAEVPLPINENRVQFLPEHDIFVTTDRQTTTEPRELTNYANNQTEQVTAKLTESVTEQVTANLTEPVNEQLTDELTKLATEQGTAKLTESTTETVTTNLTESVNELMTVNLTESVTADLKESVTERVTDNLTESVTERVTANLTESMTDPVTAKLTQSSTLTENDTDILANTTEVTDNLTDLPQTNAQTDVDLT